ncbi:DivIVA domain-containing protein [Arthrobacter sp.]|uniref:DivIVA domain-containing protein n=1 Tax=Arthrobacter sp. TaxID=1667 RepID=UPI00258B225E|nr:DivIVA domain-containing protein [Arthrobacter sp.]
MSYFLIFLAVMLAAAVALYVVGLKRPAADIYDDGLQPPVAGLPPVLLPDAPAPEDVDRVRFALGLRGYHMDQVDQVLDRLRDELAAKDARIAELGKHDGAAPSGANVPDSSSGIGVPGEGDVSGVEPGKEA